MQELRANAGPNPAHSFHDAAPFRLDRAAAWKYFTEPGEVYEVNGQWYLTSPEAVRFAHQHHEIFSSAKVFKKEVCPVPLIPIGADRPEHARYRRILDPMFAPRAVDKLEGSLRAQVGELIDRFASTGSCEVMKDLAVPYPTQVIMTMFGLPLEDRDKLMAWTKIILGTSNAKIASPGPEMAEATRALFGYVQGFIDQKRVEPADDLISFLLALTGEDAWSNEEMLGLCFLFVLAGLDTVTSSIGFVLMHLAQSPEWRRRLVADPGLVPPFIEEVLRLELAAPFVPRVTSRDVEVCGKTIPAGSYCHLALGAVNRAERGDSADRIDLSRAEQGHLTFGGGIHRCLGSHLARRELRLVVEELHKRIPEYSIAGGFQPEVAWPSSTLHLTALPLVFPVGGAR